MNMRLQDIFNSFGAQDFEIEFLEDGNWNSIRITGNRALGLFKKEILESIPNGTPIIGDHIIKVRLNDSFYV